MGDGRDWRGVLATALLPHQIEAVEWMRTREASDGGGGGVLADDMGMGKTLDCIALATSTAGAAALWARAGTDDAPRAAATLVVTPLCLLDQWRLQIGRHAPPRSPVVVYHGADRHNALASFLSRGDDDNADNNSSGDGDVDGVRGDEGSSSRSDGHRASANSVPHFVLTTYETMRHEHVSAATAGRRRALETTWFRVVLDEAHRIRAAASGCHEAALALRARRRWCVTGTPYNNSVDDLRALARFIGVAPYDSDTWWESPALGAPTRQARLHQWTRAFVLMRNKRDVLGDTLPPCTTTIVRVRLDAAERAFYDDLVRSAARAYAAFAAAPPRDRARPRMFGAVLAWVSRLRQACDHPLLAMGRGWTIDAMASGRDRGPARCGCCARLLDGDPAGGACVPASCGHRLCRVCAPATAGASRRRRGRALPCLPCRAALRWTAAVATATGPAGRERGSTKLRALVAYCVEALSADPTARIVVFSQWTACLDMAARLLTEAGVASVRYDGDVAGIARRAAVLATFAAAVGAQEISPAPAAPTPPSELSLPSLDQHPSSGVASSSIGMPDALGHGDGHREDTTEAVSTEPIGSGMRLRSGATVGRAGGGAARVLLASLHCAGVGLDLSAANHVVLIDAWYNPFIEKQACDRVHRIGQTREVKVVRLCVASSVEADVARIQARKLREAADLGLGARIDTATTATVAPSGESDDETTTGPAFDDTDDRDGARTGLSDTDIHEIFRRAMSRCRLCPVPAPASRIDSRSATAVVTAGKRKRD